MTEMIPEEWPCRAATDSQIQASDKSSSGKRPALRPAEELPCREATVCQIQTSRQSSSGESPTLRPANEEIIRTERTINWYPGHMARSRRLLAEQLSRTDAVIELCDARIPGASRNPDLDALLSGKPRLLVLNKADLAEPEETQKWLAFLRRQGVKCLSYNGLRGNVRSVLDRISDLTREKVEALARRGVKKTVRLMVAGVPNVGKSTFINRLSGSVMAKTGDRPGVTRSNQWVRINPYLELLDTPGLLWPKIENQEDARALALIGTINDQVLDQQAMAIELLMRLRETHPEAIRTRFHIRNMDAEGEELLCEACRGRGWIVARGEVDMDRGAAVILDEFRAGKLGAVTLERVPEEQV